MQLKEYIKTTLLSFLFAVTALCMVLSSCEKDDNNGIDEVILSSYGPMPIARGAELRFIGENLDQVDAVIIPGDLEITSSEFVSQSKNGIKLIVPQDAEEGYVQLLAGENVITTKTPIGYYEPISIESFSPTTIKPGAVLTLSGDYLNLVGEVIFTDRVTVDSAMFTSKSRKEITLVVPKEAQTGKMAISNGAEDPIIIYAESELEVIIPTFRGLTPNPVKPGNELNFTGTNLDLVTSITFGGGVQTQEFTEVNGTSIKVSVPMDAQDGKLLLGLASGVTVTSEEVLNLVMPTLSVSPSTIKNGEILTVSGEDLDLINTVVFADGVEGSIGDGSSSTQLTVVVPDAAVSGEVVFITNSSKLVSGGNITIVSPSFTEFAPISTKPNTSIVITGNNLDVVDKVLFSGDVEGVINQQLPTELNVTIPVGAETGVITLVAINGVEVISGTEIEILQNLPNFDSYGENKATPGEILTIRGTNLGLIKELVFPEEISATEYGIKTDSQIEVYVPVDVTTGFGQIKMITYEGEEGLLPELFIGGTDPITSETIMVMDYEPHGDHNGYWDNSWSGNTSIVEEGGNTYLHVDATIGDGWLMNCNHQSSGAPGPIINNVENYMIKLDIRIEEGVTGADNAAMQFVLGDSWNWFGSGLFPSTTNGNWITVSVDAAQLNLSGTLDLSSGTNGMYGGPIPGGISIDNLRFDPK
ncbi:glycan-binding surface protein [Plebeiibacterium marinum]|uniref:Glycan-binding surface protein n=1 Tax=Plebeiibacterium marinum TaxID=2992111 RepID=A0AAE3MCQ9_9BACT|nr:glycan-binding surface protein [Plebeiobacterium marinum]MCW3805356.1 glycan-binding surface protein [Plebeiobacterium marinum]